MIDLHCHSTYSDGELSIKELLSLANKIKIEVFSITDHNNIDAHLEISKINLKNYYDGILISGCEFICMYEGIRIEVLGYKFKLDSVKEWLDDNFMGEKNYSNCFKQFEILYNMCKKKKLIIDENLQYDPKKYFPMDFIHSELVKHTQNKSIMGEKEFNSNDFFYRKCTTDKNYILYYDFSLFVPSLEEVSSLIRQNGGKVFLAHPYGYKLNNYDDFFNKLVSSKLIDGFECYHSSFNETQTAKLINFCNNNALFISGGSDFHNFKNQTSIGYGLNNKLNIPKEIFDMWN